MNKDIIDSIAMEIGEFAFNKPWQELKDAEKMLCKVRANRICDIYFIPDGIWCPRCGEVFHTKDMEEHPEDYYTCSICHTIQHTKCRGHLDHVWERLTLYQRRCIECGLIQNKITDEKWIDE